ncbi:unnamed protein product [Chrysoparadoxa australica]
MRLTRALQSMSLAQLRQDIIRPSGGSLIHLNNAGASPQPRPVLQRVISHMQSEAELGGYEAADMVAEELRGVYVAAAQLINAKPNEIALQESASMAWAKLVYGLGAEFRAGERVLVCEAEYGANYVALLQLAKRSGATIEVIPSDSNGQVDVGELERMLSQGGVRLCCITHVPTNGGLVNPAASIGKLCQRSGVLYMLDACQSVGQLSVDVQEIGCDALCVTGRKFLRGPRGTGFLYVSSLAMPRFGEPGIVDHSGANWVSSSAYELQQDAKRYEFWEANIAAQLGLGEAIRYALDVGLENIEDRVKSLGRLAREGLGAIEGVTVHDIGVEMCGIVSFSVQGVEAAEVKRHLRELGITVSTSGPGSTLLDASKRNLPTLVRASPHYFNTEEEVAKLVEGVQQLQ